MYVNTLMCVIRVDLIVKHREKSPTMERPLALVCRPSGGLYMCLCYMYSSMSCRDRYMVIHINPMQ